MTTFELAKIGPVLVKSGADAPTSAGKAPIDVQFNPTSLKIDRRCNVAKASVLNGAQAKDYPSTQGATLTVDLLFDTSEEAPYPVDVRDRTALVRQFTEPPADKAGEAPPGISFQWGKLIFTGVVSHLGEELEYFAPNGVALRAKVSLTIEEHDPRLEKKGPAARDAKGSRSAGDGAAAAPGALTASLSASLNASLTASLSGSATASLTGTGLGRLEASLSGESAQQLAVRVGGDPTAWRALMPGLESPLTIPAGTTVAVTRDVEVPVTPERVLGFTADLRVGETAVLAGTLGLGGTLGRGGLAAGIAVSAAGGITAAAARVEGVRISAEVSTARAGFAVPEPSASSATGPASSAAGPASSAARPASSAIGPASSAAGSRYAPPPPVDARASTYGRSVPLRAVADQGTLAQARAAGGGTLARRARPAEVPVDADRGDQPWARLPASTARGEADRAQRTRDARASTLRWRPGGRS